MYIDGRWIWMAFVPAAACALTMACARGLVSDGREDGCIRKGESHPVFDVITKSPQLFEVSICSVLPEGLLENK